MTQGGPRVRQIPAGDTQPRLVCPDCGYIAYENPKIVVGSVCTSDDRVLLCRRAIDPRKGFWTLPAGFLELNESPHDGALREAIDCAAVPPHEASVASAASRGNKRDASPAALARAQRPTERCVSTVFLRVSVGGAQASVREPRERQRWEGVCRSRRR